MKIISIDKIYDESFVDNSLKKIEWDLQKKVFHIETDGVYLECDPGLNKAVIQIENWTNLIIMERPDGAENKMRLLKIDGSVRLKSIYKLIYTPTKLTLIDFGYNSCIDFVFENADVTIYGEYDEDSNNAKPK